VSQSSESIDGVWGLENEEIFRINMTKFGHMSLARTTDTPAGHPSHLIFPCMHPWFFVNVDYANTLLEYAK
jgi:hypothetical protein